MPVPRQSACATLSFGTIEKIKIFTQSDRTPNQPMPTSTEEGMPNGNGTRTRRSGRVTLRIAMQVFEHGTDKRIAVEEAHSVRVSLWGGLVALKSPVCVSQKLMVVNRATSETKEARVVSVGPLQLNKRLIGFEFLEPSPKFWGVVFPPVGARRMPARSVYRAS